MGQETRGFSGTYSTREKIPGRTFFNGPVVKTFFLQFAVIVALFSTSGSEVNGQAGGNNTWEFLNLTNSARIASLGGKNISLNDGDLNLVFHNPALLDSTMNNHLVLNYVNYFAGINFGYASWAYHHNYLGSFAAGINYINYGTLTGADESGQITGDFTASENSLNLSWSIDIESLFSLGVTAKSINSSFEQYKAFGMAVDAGINYYNPEQRISASLVMRNLGTQLSTWYPGGEKEPLPFEVQIGVTRQLAHAPFRFSLLLQHLQDFNLAKDKSSGEENSGHESSFFPKAESFGNELLRHLIVGVEVLPSQSFSLQAGYNNLRRHELKIQEKVSTVGFSWGFGVRVNRFRVNFGQARYHLAGSSNHFSVTTNLSSFYTR